MEIMNIFQSFRRFLCVCPCCGDLVRFSDLRIEYKGKTPTTWLDSYKTKVRKLEDKEEELDEKEEALRERARQRGRKKVPLIVQKSMYTEFAKLKYDPYDIKAILHPVDFVVFNGMHSKKMKDVVFLSKQTNNLQLNKVRSSVEKTIDKAAYDWQTAHVEMDGSIKFE
jgi:predicted Holliday junction resolvase-like endonuclease